MPTNFNFKSLVFLFLTLIAFLFMVTCGGSNLWDPCPDDPTNSCRQSDNDEPAECTTDDIQPCLLSSGNHFLLLPIHDNDVQINGGAWNYSYECSVIGDHAGFDFDGEEGDAIYAAASGMVGDVKNSDCPTTTSASWGCYVDIDHDIDGDGNPDYTTKYSHLRSGSITVSIGASVTASTRIASMGNTGYSSGAHLDWRVQNHGTVQYLDNDYWLDPYNLYGEATCCDIPNGCPHEGSASDHHDFDCSNATDPGYLWASCPPTWDAEVEEPDPTSTTYPLTMFQVNANDGSYDVDGYYLHVASDTDNNQLVLADDVIDDIGDNSDAYVNTWLSGRLTSDYYDDFVRVSVAYGMTKVRVFTATGNGDVNTGTRWLRVTNEAVDGTVFMGDTTGGDIDDLIMGYANSSSKVLWYVYESTGSSFTLNRAWETDQTDDTFGDTTDTFAVGDFNGNGQVEILRGREQSDGKLKWKRLASGGTTVTLSIVNIDDGATSETWGSPKGDSLYLAADVDADGKDELVQIQVDDDTVGVYVANYWSSDDTLHTDKWASDVGGADGFYYLYDVNGDGMSDLIRWGSSDSVVWMENTGSSFRDGSSHEHSLISGSLARSSKDTLVFGDFGVYDSIRGIISATEEPDDEDGTGEPSTDCDADGDGHDSESCGGTDCNDSNASIYYGASEICGNGVDDDCVGGDVPCGETYCYDSIDNDLDGLIDCDDSDCTGSTWCEEVECDADGDGRNNTDCGGTDCNDSNASIYYGAPETCGNGVDEDCDGSDLVCSETNCTNSRDDDSDGYTDCDDPDCSSDSACATTTMTDADGDGYDDDSTDCGWWDANIYPGAPELADWVDNDCDGSTDEGCSTDCLVSYWSGCVDDFYYYYNGGSLTHVCTGAYIEADYDGDGDGDSTDCAWWNATIYHGAAETADWNDNDCDGTTDEGCDGSCSGNYASGCSDDYQWWYLGTASTAPICY